MKTLHERVYALAMKETMGSSKSKANDRLMLVRSMRIKDYTMSHSAIARAWLVDGLCREALEME